MEMSARKLRNTRKTMVQVFRNAWDAWNRHNAPRLGAALAYYAVLSLAPGVIVGVAICGLAFGPRAVRGEVYWEVTHVAGAQIAVVVETLLKSAYEPKAGFLATVLGFIMMLLGASGVFVELRDTLNYIWDAPEKIEQNVWTVVKDRFLSFAMVIGAGLLLTASLVFTAIVQAAGAFSGRYFKFPTSVVEVANFLVTLTVTSLLFALIYRVIPEVRVDWRDVATGAILTALLFSVGKLVIGLYLGKAGIASAYGAAGSLVVLLVWVYYSAQIFLFGAEFTYAYARWRRSRISV
jgi:membrane protein